VRVSWDPAKNLANRRKHGLSFEEAARLFSVDHLVLFDEAHSQEEDRFVGIGPIRSGVIVVVWSEENEDEAHIISARKATSRERGLYYAHMGRKR